MVSTKDFDIAQMKKEDALIKRIQDATPYNDQGRAIGALAEQLGVSVAEISDAVLASPYLTNCNGFILHEAD